jgi:hypothetical protein
VSVAFSPYEIKMIFDIISSDYNKLGAGIIVFKYQAPDVPNKAYPLK